MSPAGVALIIGFIVILIVCIMIDKKGSEKFKKQIEERYPVKEAYGRAYVTEKGELLYRLESGTVLGYKKWNISDIAYIATFNVRISSGGAVSTHKKQFSFLDKNTCSSTSFNSSILIPIIYSSFKILHLIDFATIQICASE